MLEWTHRKIQNKSQGFSSLADAYDDLLYECKEDVAHSIDKEKTKDIEIIRAPSVSDMEAELMPLLEVLGLKNVELTLQPVLMLEASQQRDFYAQLQRNIPMFLRLVGENCQDECRDAGMSDKMIARLAQGLCPENYTPHLKIPFEFGGMPSLGNLSLVKTHPVHDNLHQIIDVQLENNFAFEYGQIFVPVFEGRVYYG